MKGSSSFITFRGSGATGLSAGKRPQTLDIFCVNWHNWVYDSSILAADKQFSTWLNFQIEYASLNPRVSLKNQMNPEL